MARILLVDDDEDVLESMAELLGRHHEVIVAAGFPQALAALGEGPLPDVVVTDYDMAPYRGDDLLAIVAARWPRVGRILHSGAPGVAAKANRLHVDHLVKKGDPSELARAIAQCLLRLRWA
jgi:DNA-binding NtrC family response regulator